MAFWFGGSLESFFLNRNTLTDGTRDAAGNKRVAVLERGIYRRGEGI